LGKGSNSEQLPGEKRRRGPLNWGEETKEGAFITGDKLLELRTGSAGWGRRSCSTGKDERPASNRRGKEGRAGIGKREGIVAMRLSSALFPITAKRKD